MKIAARFPVKSNRFLYGGIILLHVGVFFTSFSLLNQLWALALVLFATIGSFYFSRKQYLLITNSPDDLCWSGEAWLMHTNGSSEGVGYLDLLASSWVTPFFCLLKFKQNDQEFAWFFTHRSLGDRLYRELCYLVNRNIKNTI